MFRVQGLDPLRFQHLFHQNETELARWGARRVVVDTKPGFPDRISVRDLDLGETALLLNFEHQPARTPYRSSHAIFVGETSRDPLNLVDELPAAIRDRMISLRAFDLAGEMVAAELCEGIHLQPLIARLLAQPSTAYLHAHYAKRGCYAARIVRT